MEMMVPERENPKQDKYEQEQFEKGQLRHRKQLNKGFSGKNKSGTVQF